MSKENLDTEVKIITVLRMRIIQNEDERKNKGGLKRSGIRRMIDQLALVLMAIFLAVIVSLIIVFFSIFNFFVNIV